MSAVSARPLRAPCVEMKYCNTVIFIIMAIVLLIRPAGLFGRAT